MARFLGRTSAPLSYFIKSLALVNFMLIGVTFFLHHAGEITNKVLTIMVPIQFLLFWHLYRKGLRYFDYTSENEGVAWFAFVLVVFALAYSNRTLFTKNKFFGFMADISYPLYLCQ